MAWQQSDLDKLNSAIFALATGSLAQTVTYGGGGGAPVRTVIYHATDLNSMYRLRAEIEAATGVSGPTRLRVFSVSKGV